MVQAERELVMFKALRLDDRVRTASVALFWVARQTPLVLSTLPFWSLFLSQVGFRRSNYFDYSILWLLLISSFMASAHLAQAAFREKGAPVVYGVYSAIQGLLCGLIVPQREAPVWWKWLAKNTASGYFITAFFS